MSAGTETGGPAFPCAHEGGQKGMTLRDWFAGQALAGILARTPDNQPDNVEACAYSYADGMLEARDL